MPIETGPDLQATSSRFCEAMRWRDFVGAANLLLPTSRELFLQQFQDENLHVVESRVVSVALDESTTGASAEYVMEYYRLPSNRIKKWRWQQQWQLAPPPNATTRLWLIHNDPPAFP